MNEAAALSVRASGNNSITTYRMGGTDVSLVRDPQCRVCNSPYRFDAEEQILIGTTFKRIKDRLPEDAEFSDSSLRRHWQNHMAVEQTIARGIVERRAQRVGKRVADAEDSLVDGMTLLETVVQKTFERIAKGEVEPTLKEGLVAAKVLAELGEYDESSMDQQAYVEAFSVYQDVARRRMGDEEFAKFGAELADNPVLAALVARYHGEADAESEAAAKDASEDS